MIILRYYCEKVERTAKIGEEELASCCAKGDSFAREELYNRYATRLTALCSRYTEEPEEAIDLMDGYKWGHTFIELNHDLLEAYSEADTSAEVVKIQNEFLESHE